MHMTTTGLSRIASLALLVGGSAGALVQSIHPDSLTDPLSPPVHLVLFFAVTLVVLGIPALVTRQSERAGVLGVLGAALLAIGLLMNDLMHSVLDFTIVPVLASDPSTLPLLADGSWLDQALGQGAFGILLTVSIPMIVVGVVALSSATLRAGVLPRWPALMHIVALILVLAFSLLPSFGKIDVVLVYLGLAGYGWVLVAEPAHTVESPSVAVSALHPAQR
jgi:hypothetical protein